MGAEEDRKAAAAARLRKAEKDRDFQTRRADDLAKALAACKVEKLQWRGRSEAQTAAKSVVMLNDTRLALQHRDAGLVTTQRALEKLQREFDEYKARRSREDAEREAASRVRIEELMERDATVSAENGTFRSRLEEVRVAQWERRAVDAERDLEAARATIRRQETSIQQLELKGHTLRAEVARWRDRSRSALASERLVSLKSGVPSMVPPATPLTLLAQNARDARADDKGENAEHDPARLKVEAEYWRMEAETERQRQRVFHQALWASDGFSQAQKQKATHWLRQAPPDADQSEWLHEPRPPPGVRGGGRPGDATRPATVHSAVRPQRA